MVRTAVAVRRNLRVAYVYLFFFFQAEDGIRDDLVTGVQTCALPISPQRAGAAGEAAAPAGHRRRPSHHPARPLRGLCPPLQGPRLPRVAARRPLRRQPRLRYPPALLAATLRRVPAGRGRQCGGPPQGGRRDRPPSRGPPRGAVTARGRPRTPARP